MKIFLIVGVICIAGAFADFNRIPKGPFYVTTCERRMAALSCKDGALIKVGSAFYGRKDRSTCPHRNIHTITCGHANNSQDEVQRRCDGKSFCAVPAHNDVFGDPCRGTHKYLEVEYSCVPTHQIGLIAHICQNDAAHLSCPLGTTIGVVDAFYGRDDTVHCANRDGRNTMCRSENSLGDIKRRCEGNRTCRIHASNSVFGNPCRGTFKFVKVYFFCH